MKKLTSGPGWSLSSDSPRLASAPSAQSAKNTASPKPQFRIEKRNGKVVTVIAGLHTYGADRLNAMAKKLKAACGSGGTVKNGNIEIQGNMLSKIKEWFEKAKT